MQASLELVGLQPRVEFDRAGWVDLAGSAGLVGLHSAKDSTLGAPMLVDEVQHDLYGYTRHEVHESRPALVVVPVRFTDEATAYYGFLRPGAHGRAGPGRRRRGRAHHVYADDLPVVDSKHAVVHPTFAVDQALDDLQKTLQSRGFEVTPSDEEFGSFIDVTDPDGQSVQVHQR